MFLKEKNLFKGGSNLKEIYLLNSSALSVCVKINEPYIKNILKGKRCNEKN